MGSRIAAHLLIIGLVLVCWLESAPAAGITIKATGEGIYGIDVAALDDIAVVDLEVGYDTLNFDAPRIDRGAALPSDVSFITNTAIPGELRVILKRSRAITAGGRIAVLRFQPIGETPGRLLSAHARLITTKGVSHALPVGVVNALPKPSVGPGSITDKISGGTGSPSPLDTAAGDMTPSPVASGGSGSRNTPGDRYAGRGGADATVTFADSSPGEAKPAAAPPGSPSPAATPAVPDMASQPAEQAATRATADQARAVPAQTIVYGRVLDRFSEVRGETAAALVALFTPPAGQKVTQQPQVAISDGRTVVTLRVELPRSFEGTPVFAVTRAKTLSWEQDGEGTWTVRVLPDADTLDAVFVTYFGEGLIQYPLVVAPALTRLPGGAPALDEAGFALFLKERAREGKPRFDLNGDGTRDYRDDYLFTANFIARGRQAAGTPAQSPTRSDN
ncbi:hypothetical protein [Geobacter sulfurreducens]|uniref:hypothetical protein n=1 Tax=Geobacter sulfurreducens TaxID=35554 RepID=UPI0020B64F9C|nr:hypothetical protein [Geobacter sulfurreducens]UTG93920.1 hypothetical protein J8622_06270 [Geobacter sulfurreducens]